MSDQEPDTTGATVYVEAGDRPIAGGRWYVLPAGEDGSERVIYERPTGEFADPAVVSADTLRTSPTWRPLPDG